MAIRKPSSSVGNSSGFSGEFPRPLNPPPDWVRQFKGYKAKTYRLMSGNNATTILTRYSPESTMGIGFDIITIVDRGNVNRIFNKMQGVWDYIKKESSSLGVKVDDDGKMRNVFGFLDERELLNVARTMLEVHSHWMKYPNESSYDDVLKLQVAKDNVDKLKYHHRWIKNEMDEMKTRIEESRRRLEELDRQLNQMFEDAADSMNLLEEHGYPQKMEYDESGNLVPDGESEGDVDSMLFDRLFDIR